MNVFIIGTSRTGKSTLSEIFFDSGYNVIKASEYFRKSFKYTEDYFKDSNEFIHAITEFSKKELQKNPYVNIDYIKNNFSFLDKNVIEGIRNPIDFSSLFNASEDIVIILKKVGGNISSTDFEEGIDIIENYMKWGINNLIIKPCQLEVIEFSSYDEILPLIKCIN